MGEATAISWADATWNPWMGCAKVSPGCANCYMFRDQRRYGNDPLVVRRSKTRFNEPLKWEEPRVVFTCSWSDWFIESADEWRADAWDIVRATPQHIYLILTKRPELVLDRVPDDWPFPNVWLGVSIENARHTFRADQLRAIPAERRFISAEPLLGSLLDSRTGASKGQPAQVSAALATQGGDVAPRSRSPLDLSGIDWLIVGGESGARDDARPMHPLWARELRDAAAHAGVDFHFKQWGSWAPYAGGGSDGVIVAPSGRVWTNGSLYHDHDEEEGGYWMRYVGGGPESGGRLLDGKEHLERPLIVPGEVPSVTLF